MKFTIALIPEYSQSGEYVKHSQLDQDNYILLILFFLFHSEIISRDKFVGMLRRHEKKLLLRKIGTHHCKINNKWYQDTGSRTMLVEAFWDVSGRVKPMEFEDVIKYTNLYLNKPRNYCIDWLETNIINPLLEDYNQTNLTKIVRSFGVLPENDVLTFEEADQKYNLSSSYCCKDCDGCLGEWKRREYERYYMHDIKSKVKKIFKDYLQSKKKNTYK